MQYFPSLLHTMVHRMHFFRRFTRRTTVPHPDQPSPEGPHFPENRNIGLPEAKHPYFYPENTALSCKEVRGFQFPKKPPHRRHPTDYPPKKAHQSITYRNIAHHQPHPKTAKNTPANPKKPHKTHPESVIFRHKAKIFRK